MTRSSFQTLLEQTWQHPIFYNNSNRPQRPPKYQLQVALYHFGGGACGSRIRTAIQFGLAEGTVEIYVHRVTVAILALQERYIRWPSPGSEQYLSTIQKHQFEYGFTNCLGFVDGTIVPVYRKPIKQGERYHTRKGNYGLNTTLIVDSTTRILYVIAGSNDST